MKGFVWMVFACLGLSLLSCSETEEYNEFEDRWPERNVTYIDSIAAVARAHQGDNVGDWMVVKAYNLKDDANSLGTVDNQEYVYAKRLIKSESTDTPLFTDSVFVGYRGRLIPTVSYPEGYIFEQSYYGELNEETIKTLVPTGGPTSKWIAGWITVLQRMHPGDAYRVYIPQKLAYGDSEMTNIPAYSTLIFDIYLQRIKRLEDW